MSTLPKRTAADIILQCEHIAQNKARARRWAEQRGKERNACAILPTAEPTVTLTRLSREFSGTTRPVHEMFSATTEVIRARYSH